MSPEAQRIAIAKVCGWTQIEDRSENIMMSPGTVVVGYPPHIPIVDKKQEIPNYLHDLNAMHEAAKVLTDKKLNRYHVLLIEICQGPCGTSIDSTAAQRAEAFLKALKLWTE